VNWYWPGETSVTLPKAVQRAKGKDRFVVEKTLKLAPDLLVKAN
jgi:hypothetical protein